jgi:UDP-N-acetylglucosamine--N-acetylmuramyl-(pentapeptide) pyrophosphoryl-undecaprenol N-acetylglucosamine transferase
LSSPSYRLLVAASGTGGHIFPALAVAECLSDCQIEWLGVPDRMEDQILGDRYPLHRVRVSGFQGKPGLRTLKILWDFGRAILQVRRILQRGHFQGVFTTGGYIAAPAIIAARSLGLPVILHESNALPGKVTRFFAPWCTAVVLGFAAAAHHLNQKATIIYTGTPVRQAFQTAASEPLADLSIPPAVPLVVIVGGSQGAVALNQLVRQAAPAWLEAGAWVVHQTGERDPDVKALQHPHYLVLPFYPNMPALLQRANLVISRAGAGTLTELAVTHTPALLIPYPFAAEDHQTHNAHVFAAVGAAELLPQSQLSAEQLRDRVLELLYHPEQLRRMAQQAATLAVPDSCQQVAALVRQLVGRSL